MKRLAILAALALSLVGCPGADISMTAERDKDGDVRGGVNVKREPAPPKPVEEKR